MEDFQAKWFQVVDYDLSESGVNPLSVDELLKMGSFDREEFFSTKLDYPATIREAGSCVKILLPCTRRQLSTMCWLPWGVYKQITTLFRLFSTLGMNW